MKAFVVDPMKLSQVCKLHDKCAVEIAEEDCSQVQSLQRSRIYWMPSMQRRVDNQLVTIVWSCGHEALCMSDLWWQQVFSLSSPPSEYCLISKVPNLKTVAFWNCLYTHRSFCYASAISSAMIFSVSFKRFCPEVTHCTYGHYYY
jgi:hypothetical protein